MSVTIRRFFLLTMVTMLVGCSSATTLNAPCPQFGVGCTKSPINHWDVPQDPSNQPSQGE